MIPRWIFSLGLPNIFSSVHSVMTDSLRSHGLQHPRLPCPSPTPGACSNSCSLSGWYHPIISSSVVPFSSCLSLSHHQIHWSFPVSSLDRVANVLKFQFQHQFCRWTFRTDFLRIDLFDLLAVQGTLKILLHHHSSKASILQHSAFFIVQLLHPYRTTGKTIALTRWMCLSNVCLSIYLPISISREREEIHITRNWPFKVWFKFEGLPWWSSG